MTSAVGVHGARRFWVVSLAVVASIFGATTVTAHSVLDESTPRNGSVVTVAPTSITLRFNESVSNPRIVLRKARTPAVSGRTTLQTDGTVVAFRPGRAITDGEYSATWRVRSADGHYISGVVRFTVRRGG
jgi:methionine-rich copper-binding protein CopC